MRNIIPLAVLLLLGCEPSRSNRVEEHIRGLQDVYQWDVNRQATGFHAYDGLLGFGEEAIPILVEHLLDDTETKIMDHADLTIPTVGDLCFHILLRLFSMRPEDFRNEGVVVLDGVPHPLFAVRFDPGARHRVQTRFRKMLEE